MIAGVLGEGGTFCTIERLNVNIYIFSMAQKIPPALFNSVTETDL